MKLPIIKPGEALALRTCNADMTAHGGFVWPRKGRVKAKDWDAKAKCGNGLHGLLWGEGDGGLLNWTADAVWMVVKVRAAECVDLEGKVKFPFCEVVYAGDRDTATGIIHAIGPGRIEGLIATGGYYATLTGGNFATLTGGDCATLCWKVWDGGRYRMHVRYVGEDGIKPNTPYRFEDGKVREGKP